MAQYLNMLAMLDSGALLHAAGCSQMASISETAVQLNIKRRVSLSSRYRYDWALCHERDGWHPFLTESDATYFGIWVHPARCIIVIYAESDEEVAVYKRPEDFVIAIGALEHRYPAIPKSSTLLDDDGVVELYPPRISAEQVRVMHQEKSCP
jgi:hypothetical protein